MIPMKLGWLLLVCASLALGLVNGTAAALLTGLVLVLIPLVSLILNLYLRKKIRSELVGTCNLRKGTEGSVLLKLTNPTVLPIPAAVCRVFAVNQLNGSQSTIRVKTWLPPRKEQTVPVKIGSDYCGRLRLSVERITLYDCFGVLGVRAPMDSVAHVTVQPDTFEPEISLLPWEGSADESEVYSQERPGSDFTEVFQIREYVPGDSPKQVHWKLSSKFDRLIVRDPALPITRNVLVFWERTGESGDLQRIDAQAEVVVSLCKGLLDQSVQFTIGWNDTGRNLCILHEIRDMDELIGIVPRLMRATGVGKGISGAELLLQTGSHALCGHMVYLAEEPQQGVAELERYGHVTKLLCGGTALSDALIFDPQNYEAQLAQITV